MVGLAIARQLAGRDGTNTLLIEKNAVVGMETSSRNSEVYAACTIHITANANLPLGNSCRPLLWSRLPEDQVVHSRPSDALRSV